MLKAMPIQRERCDSRYRKGFNVFRSLNKGCCDTSATVYSCSKKLVSLVYWSIIFVTGIMNRIVQVGGARPLAD